MSAAVVTENLLRLRELLCVVERDPRVTALHAALESGSLTKALPREARDALEIDEVAVPVLAQVAVIAARAIERVPVGHDLLRDLHRRILCHHGQGRR